MKNLHAHLRLTDNFSGRTRERCPNVVFAIDGQEVAVIRTDTEHPQLPFDDDEIRELVIFDDALSRVIDEEVWLQEFQRVLTPGGEMRLTLPAAGPLAWIDAMNIYRYITDITGRGDEPNASLPTGWNRHYSQRHIRELMETAGFSAPIFRKQNYAAREAGMLASLMRDNWLRKDKHAERNLFPVFGKRDPDGSSWPAQTTWTVRTTKPVANEEGDPIPESPSETPSEISSE